MHQKVNTRQRATVFSQLANLPTRHLAPSFPWSLGPRLSPPPPYARKKWAVKL